VETLSGRISGPAFAVGYAAASYTCSHGTQPGILTVVVADAGQGNPIDVSAVCDVDLTDGQRSFTIKGCRPTGANRVRVGDGWGWQVTLEDRRWAWRLRKIDAAYNVRDAWATDPAKKIIPVTRVDVHTLATLCLQAMGEAEGSWDLGDLPNPDQDELLPEITWNAANPALSLADLVESYHCRLIYQPIKDRVVIAKEGKGADVPDGSFEVTTPAKVRPARPEKVQVIGAPAAFSAALVLEAVGLDLDGSVVPIDQLSYKPKLGWKYSGPPFFPGVVLPAKYQAKGKTLADVKAACQKSAYRWFRVTLKPLPKDDSFGLPGLDQFTDSLGGPVQLIDRDQLLPLERIVGVDRDEDRHLYASPAKCYGSYIAGSMASNTKPEEPVRVGFQIDSARGLVMFDHYMGRVNLAQLAGLDPVLGIATAGAIGVAGPAVVALQGYGPADLILVCSVHVLDLKTRHAHPVHARPADPGRPARPGQAGPPRRDPVRHLRRVRPGEQAFPGVQGQPGRVRYGRRHLPEAARRLRRPGGRDADVPATRGGRPGRSGPANRVGLRRGRADDRQPEHRARQLDTALRLPPRAGAGQSVATAARRGRRAGRRGAGRRPRGGRRGARGVGPQDLRPGPPDPVR
jgi:hypothetical protein